MTEPLHSQLPTKGVTSSLQKDASSGYSPSVSVCIEGLSSTSDSADGAAVIAVANRTKHDKNVFWALF